MQIEFTFTKGKAVFYLLGKYPVCWWSGNARSQSIRKPDMDLFFPEYNLVRR